MNKIIFFKLLLLISVYLRAASASEKDFKLNMDLYHQKYEFSCEAAALKAILNYEKIVVQEDDIIKHMPIDPTIRTTAIWGDPDKGFVGDIYGKNANVSYGIHWPGLQKVSQHWGLSKAGKASNSSVLVKYIQKNKPVIVWVVSENASGKDLSWKTPSGKLIKAVEGEHTIVVYGFRGPPEKPSGFYFMDPSMGFTFKSTKEFEKNWKRLGNSYLTMIKLK